jgi:hypothetical protein
MTRIPFAVVIPVTTVALATGVYAKPTTAAQPLPFVQFGATGTLLK